MKVFLLIAAFLLVLLRCTAFEPAAQVATSNDLALVIFTEGGGKVCRPDERIGYAFKSLTNEWMLFVPKSAFFYTAKLLDPNGSNVALTPRGREVGNKFEPAPSFSRDLIARYESHPNDLQRLRVRTTNGTGGNFLFRPDEMFHMQKAGSYSLQLQFQIFGQKLSSRNTNFILHRFAPVQIQVIQAIGSIKD